MRNAQVMPFMNVPLLVTDLVDLFGKRWESGQTQDRRVQYTHRGSSRALPLSINTGYDVGVTTRNFSYYP